jgi:phospholipase D1/2
MKRVRKISRHNWKAYVSEEGKEMRGHLLQYPIQVSRSGKVSALPGHETFPDVGGKVLGSPTTLPDVLTT